jgi:hypothetical protein
MASCDAADVQVRAFSPPFRRARETRTDAIPQPTKKCHADKKGVACPDGWCRSSGVLRKQVVTRVHPWGSDNDTLPPHRPPDWTEEDKKRELAEAVKRRDAFAKEMVPALNGLIALAEKHALALAVDEQERLEELREWLKLLP